MAAVMHRDVKELAEALQSDAVVIDVRTPSEFASGHVPGARNLPLGTLPESAKALDAGPVWVICRSGGRSAQAASLLAGQGREVINVMGGTLAWRRAGLPLDPPDGPPDWRSLLMPAVACVALGLAPLTPQPHIIGKLRWVAGGAVGMAAIDWLDLLMHGAPWVWLAYAVVQMLRRR